MGELYKLTCGRCGYEKELAIGGGLASCSISLVNRLFSEEKRMEFDTYYISNKVESFCVENTLSLCDECKELISTSVLKARLTSNASLEISNDCPVCSKKLKIIKGTPVCPKCGLEMTSGRAGHWD
ncbi:MAG TPA: hypothetical protein VHP38_04510 [Ruminiclostridium sp.]|nr:hypothetical protein [Ruminiclostridium sp.]